MKVGIAQINTRAADFIGNSKKIEQSCLELHNKGADFAVFAELSLTGFGVKDLALDKNFLEKSWSALEELAPKLKLPCLLGVLRPSGKSRGAFNSAVWIEGGKIKHIYDKVLLPDYDIADEPRFTDSGSDILIVPFKDKKIAITICEDIWSLEDVSTSSRYTGFKPLQHLHSLNFASEKKAFDLLVNISASVFSTSNDNVRKSGAMLEKVSDYLGVPLVWCNLVGGNDGVIYAGGSGVFVGKEVAGKAASKVLKKFQEDFLVLDPFNISENEGDFADYNSIADLHDALVLGLKDFVEKCGFKKVLLGLSGGIDSALVAALAVEALGAENVLCVSLPSKISSEHSKADAKLLAKNYGAKFLTVSIAPIVEGATAALSEAFAGYESDVTEENLQSRARGLALMALSNKFGMMLLTCGNKSEAAVGYCTLYGDTCGALAPIADLYKTQVYELSNYINQKSCKELIPQNTIDKAPSAELREGQCDQDSLPPYGVLDEVLRLYIEEKLSISEIVARGFDLDIVLEIVRKVEMSEYKRSQLPICIKVSKCAFGAGRRMPLARKF